MKKFLFSLILLIFLFALSSCGSAAPTPVPSEEPTPAPPAPSLSSVLPGSELPSSTVETSVPETHAVDEAKLEAARDCIGEDVSVLYDAIGKPADSSYASSCLLPGAEDGELYYDGFTVATLREAEKETVRDVNVNAG